MVLLCWFWGFGLLYYFVYLFLFFFVCALFDENVMFIDQIYSIGSLGVFFLFLIFLSFSGFPPFLGFFYKYVLYSVLGLSESGGVVVFWVLFFFSVLMVVRVFRYLVVFVKFVFLKDVFICMWSLSLLLCLIVLYVILGLFVLVV